MPIGEWLKGPMAGEFEAALDGLESDLLDAAAVRDTYRDHCRGRGEHGKFLWAVYVFADWHRRMRERDLLA
jgi:gluconate kinase